MALRKKARKKRTPKHVPDDKGGFEKKAFGEDDAPFVSEVPAEPLQAVAEVAVLEEIVEGAESIERVAGEMLSDLKASFPARPVQPPHRPKLRAKDM